MEELEKKEAAGRAELEEPSELTQEDPSGTPEEAGHSLPENGTEEEQPMKPEKKASGAFVIKRRSAVSGDGAVRAVTAEQFLREHPELASVKGPTDLRGPLLVISRRAEREIKKHIGWAKKTRQNVREQGGILIGSPFLVDGRTVSVVECVIPAELSESSAAYLKMDTETWVKMLNIYDERYQEQGLYVMGWFHTHPNSLGVFMSSTDMGTQQRFFREDWHFAVVLNPHRRLAACFHSAQAFPCALFPPNFADR